MISSPRRWSGRVVRIEDRMSERSQTGTDLLQRAIAGDSVALERLLVRYQSRLLRRLHRKIPATLARVVAPEDVLQETLFSVFRAIGNFRPTGLFAFERWIVTIADNCLLDAIRGAGAAKRGGGWGRVTGTFDQSHALGLLDMVAADTRTPSRATADREMVRTVLGAIGRLRPEYQEPVRLKFVDGLHTAEVAHRLGKSEWSVHKLCARGLRDLEAVLAENWRPGLR
jgi:RNA polymerase sigma factor (sigma-70 family)